MGFLLYPLAAFVALWVAVRVYRSYNRISIKDIQGPSSGWLLGEHCGVALWRVE